MKLTTSNENYAASVVEVSVLSQLQGMDRCEGIQFFGCQVIVSNGLVKVGDKGLFFTSETKLSPDFLRNNNLYRHANLNADPTKTGYFEDSGRVKALKLRGGNVSSAFFIPLSSLSYLGVDHESLKVGDSFTDIDGVTVCEKYVKKQEAKTKVSRTSRTSEKLFPKHKSTLNWHKTSQSVHPNAYVVVTQKLHGTSARFTNQLVQRKLGFWERVLRACGVKVVESEYAGIAGTRNTVRDVDDPGFYGSDVWTEHFEKIRHKIPKNWVVYGEIVGYAGAKAIQHSYTYGYNPGESELFVYRIAIVNSDGIAVDLDWQAVKEFCHINGMKAVPELAHGEKQYFEPSEYVDVVFSKDDRFSECNCLPLSNPDTVDEGVVVRVEGMFPNFHKVKSPLFLVHESKCKDSDAEDLEEESGE